MSVIEASAMNKEIWLFIFNGVWVVAVGLWVAWDTITSDGFFDFKGSLSPELFKILKSAPANEERCVLTVSKEVLAEVIVLPPKGLRPLGFARTGGGPETSSRLSTGGPHE